ncbi:hypothetical protein A9Q80_04365 [Cycloclasticus sp. 46_83_sub15_T18]|nr:hypothetical protein A9Q80_04365 [Cycloclasticus sp. 46_83_sub15_T18]
MSVALLSWALLAEAAIVGLVVLFVIFFVLGKDKQAQRKAVSSITKKFKKDHSQRSTDITADLAFASVDGQLLEEFLRDIEQKEAKLYRQIMSMFLQKDVSLVKACDKSIAEVSAAYWEGLRKSIQHRPGTVDNAESLKAEANLKEALLEQERLNDELTEALTTLDEVSNEYSHLFSSNKDQEELAASKERMLACFQQAVKE